MARLGTARGFGHRILADISGPLRVCLSDSAMMHNSRSQGDCGRESRFSGTSIVADRAS